MLPRRRRTIFKNSSRSHWHCRTSLASTTSMLCSVSGVSTLHPVTRAQIARPMQITRQTNTKQTLNTENIYLYPNNFTVYRLSKYIGKTILTLILFFLNTLTIKYLIKSTITFTSDDHLNILDMQNKRKNNRTSWSPPWSFEAFRILAVRGPGRCVSSPRSSSTPRPGRRWVGAAASWALSWAGRGAAGLGMLNKLLNNRI